MTAWQARELLQKLMPNEAWDSHDMADTPTRWAKMMSDMTDRETAAFNFTTFDSGCDEIVMVRNIRFVTLCAHHLVPFIGTCHVGYVPNGRIVGLSKIPRLVHWLCKGTWCQEDLTAAIANEMTIRLDPLGVGVVMEAEHLCMKIRGVEEPDASTVTSVMKGVFADHERTAKAEFMTLMRGI
jgi:GTP cyclohydrolase I